MTILTIFHDHSFKREKTDTGKGHMIFFEGFEADFPYSISLTEAEYVALYNVMKEL